MIQILIHSTPTPSFWSASTPHSGIIQLYCSFVHRFGIGARSQVFTALFVVLHFIPTVFRCSFLICWFSFTFWFVFFSSSVSFFHPCCFYARSFLISSAFRWWDGLVDRDCFHVSSWCFHLAHLCFAWMAMDGCPRFFSWAFSCCFGREDCSCFFLVVYWGGLVLFCLS